MNKLPLETMDKLGAAIAVCDKDLKLLYMNGKAAASFSDRGGMELIGSSLEDCHKVESVAIMRSILATGKPNVYTISKGGKRKLIWQGPWQDDDGKGGLVEISILLPEQLPHYDRG